MNLVQDQSNVSVYFTKLKTIWEELSNYRPVCTCGKCSCGGVKELHSHYQMEYIMSFLMGLHDSFAQVRGQLLLMDPLPPINKVFALISQEEHQRKVGVHVSSSSAGTMAFAVKNDYSKKPGESTRSYHSTGYRNNSGGYKNNSGNHNTGGYKGQRKERPYCSHCNFHGHTIEKCYKIHGYPPGFTARQRYNNSYPNNHKIVNQVSNQSYYNSNNKSDQQGTVGNFVQNLNTSQYQQFMSMLSNHLSTPVKHAHDQNDLPTTSYATGICSSVSLNPIFSSSQFWIVDSGATRHICSNAAAFISMRSIQNSNVTLPNHTRIPVHFSGDIRLSSMIVLKDVLFVP